MISVSAISACSSKPVSEWSDAKVQKWCKENPFFKSLASKPSETTDLREFATQYIANQAEWDAAFEFLSNSDLATMALGRHDITGNGTYANVQEYTSHYGGKYECHRDYIDIQYIVSGHEITGLAPLSAGEEMISDYDKNKDCQLFAKASDFVDVPLNPEVFAIFFPSDLHAPGMADGDPSPVRKVVIKVPVAR